MGSLQALKVECEDDGRDEGQFGLRRSIVALYPALPAARHSKGLYELFAR